MNRYGKSETEIYSSSTDKIYRMAKNEIETAQIAITSDADYKNMKLEVTDLVNENGAVLETKLYCGYYYNFDMSNQLFGGDGADSTNDYYVEPLLTMPNKFDLEANTSKLFYIKVTTPIDAESGFYTSKVNLIDSEGRTVKTATLRLYVWDFALSEETACAGSFGIAEYGIIIDAHDAGILNENYSKVTAEDVENLRVMWYEYLLENRMTPSKLPYDLEDSRNDEYIHNPRVSAFTAAESELTNEQIAELFRRHADDEEWIDKAIIYTVDEPNELWQFADLDTQWEELKELIPDINFHCISPLATNQYSSKFPGEMDYAERIANSTNILCPQTYAFTPFSTAKMQHDYPDVYPKYSMCFETNQMHYDKYGEFADRYAAWGETGNYKMWWYTCCSPEFPYANWFKFYRGEGQRVLLWQQYMNNIDGILYWSVDFWNVAEKTTEKITRKKLGSGDGLLCYPMAMFGQKEMIPSVRFEYVRDSIEDFQYMEQLEDIIGRDEVMKFVNEVTVDMLHFTEDDAVIQRQRDNMGFMLENMQ